MLKNTFGPKRKDAKRDWVKVRNERLHDFYSSPDIIRRIMSGRIRGTRHVAHMGKSRNA